MFNNKLEPLELFEYRKITLELLKELDKHIIKKEEMRRDHIHYANRKYSIN